MYLLVKLALAFFRLKFDVRLLKKFDEVLPKRKGALSEKIQPYSYICLTNKLCGYEI